MMWRKKIKLLFNNPSLIGVSLLVKTASLWSDVLYLQLMFRLQMGKRLNLKNPQSFSEKLQWLKLYDRKPEYTIMVDKYAVKKYVADIIGEEYIIPTLGIWNKFEDIDLDKLPNQFVLKCTHDSGGLIICKDKSTLNVKEASKKIIKSQKTNYYLQNREWPYKNVKPCIIAEKYMIDNSTQDLPDYKFFCFNGEVKALFIAVDRNSEAEETKFNFYDENFNLLPFTNGHPNATIELEKPKNFEKMKELAKKLSEKIPQVRIDFYEVNDRVYFGEITFFHWSGLVPFEPEEWDYKLGSWIKLPIN